MRVLGIDPGNATLGYGIIDGDRLVCYGSIVTSSTDKRELRLKKIYEELTAIVEEYRPNEMAVEEIFFNKNIKTAIAVSEARGVSLLVAAIYNLNVKGYTPLQVKQGVASYGRANKRDVQFMVKLLLGLDELPKPDDAADALAIAITHNNYLNNFNV